MLKPVRFASNSRLYKCPVCEKMLVLYNDLNYCFHCGVALDIKEALKESVINDRKVEEERHTEELRKIEKKEKALNERY